jgi:hypothetical protein
MTKESSFPSYEINGPMTIFFSLKVSCLPPNFEDEDLSIDQPVNEVVNINQQVSIHNLKGQFTN